VGFYAQVIVPLLCDVGLDRPFVAKHRRELLVQATDNILEIGFRPQPSLLWLFSSATWCEVQVGSRDSIQAWATRSASNGFFAFHAMKHRSEGGGMPIAVRHEPGLPSWLRFCRVE
jgi:hypothetical protein